MVKRNQLLFLTVVAAVFLGGCSLWQQSQAPVAPEGGIQESNVKIVVQQPAADCVFKGGIMGDTNPDVAGLPSGVVDLSETIRQGLISSANQMGGNTVWLRTTSWQNPALDTDYAQNFVVNNVQYGALVYSCPN